jgi:uncharacterized protein (DUF433 family)
VNRISIDPNRMRGLPCIRDTRVTVSAVLGQLAAGRTAEAILRDYPCSQFDDILGALTFAAEAVQERELPLLQPAGPAGRRRRPPGQPPSSRPGSTATAEPSARKAELGAAASTAANRAP